MKLLSVLTSLLVGVLLSGCGVPSVQHQARYPAEISGIGDSPNYPLHVAGFERGKIFTYAPGMKEISTAYNLVSPDLQIASTIYLLPLEKAASPLTAQLAREKGAIEQYHPWGRVAERRGTYSGEERCRLQGAEGGIFL